MKQQAFCFSVMFIAMSVAYTNLSAQDYVQGCKLETDKKDDFTGELVRTSKQLIHKKGNNKKIGMYIRRVNDKYEIEINIIVSTVLQWATGKNYGCEKNDRLLIKLRNEEVVMLPVNSWNSRWEQPNLGKRFVLGAWAALSKDYKYFFEIKYKIPIASIKKLAASQMIKMRIELRGYDNDTNKPFENIEFNVLPEYAKSVMKDAKCILR